MNCGEAREYLIAFLDGELDASLSVEVQLHLDHCCDCAREAEIERTIRGRLAGVLQGRAASPTPDEEVLLQALRAAGLPLGVRSYKRFGK